MKALLVLVTLTLIAIPAMAEDSTTVTVDSTTERTDSAYVEWKKAYDQWKKDYEEWQFQRDTRTWERIQAWEKWQETQPSIWWQPEGQESPRRDEMIWLLEEIERMLYEQQLNEWLEDFRK